MATSDNRVFTLDVADVIEEAYERIGMEVRSGYQAQKARRSLNIMFQDWGNRGINLWEIATVTTPVEVGTTEYALNSYDIDVIEAVLRRDGVDYRLERINREDYMSLALKSNTGRPTKVYVERSVSPKLHVWPVPDSASDSLVTSRLQTIQSADALTNDVDVPSRFIPAMVSGLAYYMAVKEAPDRVQMMKMMYDEDFTRALNEDSERGSWFITPNFMGKV